MTQAPVATRVAEFSAAVAPFTRYFFESPYQRLASEPGINDFVFGNPHEMPLPDYVQALQHYATPQNKNWFAYKTNEPDACEHVAESLRQWRGLPFEEEDIFLTNGGWAAIALALYALVNPGDEVIFMTPPWFFYDLVVKQAEGVAVRVPIRQSDFDLDVEAIAAAISPRTRAVLVNSPHNPTGKVYSAATLQALAEVLEAASRQHGQPIYLLSDEAYSRILFDGRSYHSPTSFYPYSLLLYTYGKTLLTPGQRVGYVALPPQMPLESRRALREALFICQMAHSFAFPNALLQHAMPVLNTLSIDIEGLQEKRDVLVEAMRGMGYDLHAPEGTFYLLPRSPIADDWRFIEVLAEHKILALPGEVVELPGYFRLSLTASMEMIQRSLPGFEAAIAQV